MIDTRKRSRRNLAPGWLLLSLLAAGLSLAAGCQFFATPTPAPQNPDAEIELLSGKAWTKPASAAGWTEFHGRLTLFFGDQIRVKEEETSPADLSLADGTVIRLRPGATVQLVRSLPTAAQPMYRLLEGRMSVEAASSDQLFDAYISATESFTYESVDLVVRNPQPGTSFDLWIEDSTVRIAVGSQGGVRVSTDEDEAILGAHWQAQAELDDGLLHVAQPTPTPAPSPTATTTSTVTHTPTITPTPAETHTPTPTSTSTLTPTVETTTTALPTAPTLTPTSISGPPANTPTPTVEPTVALPQVYEAPLLLEPPSNSVFGFDQQQTVTLSWVPQRGLGEEHWYEIQTWQKGEEPIGVHWGKSNWWDMGAEYYPGDYSWRVIIVEGQGDDVVGAVSPPSETRTFRWIAVAPTQPRPPTNTPRPTNTPVPPTDTPVPTNTPSPTDTPTPRPTAGGTG